MRVAVEPPSARPGGVLLRGLLTRLGERAEPVPLVHAVAIALGCAARVHAAHARGVRAITAPETVLVRFDGLVLIGGVRVVGGEQRADVVALARLVGELVKNAFPPGELLAAIEADHPTAADFARRVAAAAKAIGLTPSRAELGRWARRQIHPQRFAHTLRREEVPELGVDIGHKKPDGDYEEDLVTSELALGSGKFDLDEVELDVELHVDTDDLIDEWEARTTASIDTSDAIKTKVAKAPRVSPSSQNGPILFLVLALAIVLGVIAYLLMR